MVFPKPKPTSIIISLTFSWCNLEICDAKNEITSLDITYDINGGTAEVYTWTGSLTSLQSTDIEFIDVEFGKDGKPVYAAGPNDNVAKIIKTLEKNVGDGNFEYIDGIPAHLLGGNEDEFIEEDEDFIDFEEVN